MESTEIQHCLLMNKRAVSLDKTVSGSEQLSIKQRVKWTIFDFSNTKRSMLEYKSIPFPITVGVNTFANAELIYTENGNWISLYISFSSLKIQDLGKMKIEVGLSLMDSQDNPVIWSMKALSLDEQTMMPGKISTWGFPEFVWRHKEAPNVICQNEDQVHFLNWSNLPVSFGCMVTSIVENSQVHQTVQSPVTAITDLSNMYKTGDFSDLVFVLGDEKLHAHKSVLAARSSVFSAMFHTDMEEAANNEVVIADCHHLVFHGFLQFVYSGKVTALEELAEDLLRLADKYAMMDLREACERKLVTTLTADNAARILIKADLYGAQQLKDATVIYIKKHMNEVKASVGWQEAVLNHSPLIIAAFIA